MKDLITRGLLIKEPWIDYIFEGIKTWEIRNGNVNFREKIALIKSKTKKIYGIVEVIDSIPLSLDMYKNSTDKHCISDTSVLPYGTKTCAWVLSNPVLFEEPIPYEHPQGAVKWVNLEYLGIVA